MHLLTAPYLVHPTTVHTLVEIDPVEGAEALTCDILLDPGRMLDKRRSGRTDFKSVLQSRSG